MKALLALLWTSCLCAAHAVDDGRRCVLQYEGRDVPVTRQLQKLLQTCAGGEVVIPRGTFVTGPINISSHTTLLLQEGAVLLGSPNKSDYPKIPAPPSYGVGRDDRSVPPYTKLRYHPLIFVPYATGV